MTYSLKRSVFVRVSLLLVAFVLIGLAIVAQRASAAGETPAVGERLVTIYDNGIEQTVITKATTVQEALAHAGVQLEAADSVEPALDTELVAKNYQLNVYRARPVLIVDGEKRLSVMTAAQSPRQIVSSAGGTLYDEDTAEFSRIDSVTSDGGAGLRLVVDRATVFQFTLYGKTFEARSQATTVGDMLAEKKVVLGPDDGVSVPQSTPLVAGMSIGVWRNGKQTLTAEEVIAKPIEEVKDTEREVGYRAVKTPGADGKKQVTYEIEMRDGVEVARVVIASVTTLEPVKEVVTVGAKNTLVPYTGTGSKTDWLRAAGIPESDWGYVDYIIGRESGWNPNAVNKTSGACGLAQALPCSKVPGNPLDPVDSLRWAHAYAQTCVSYRMYCGWEGAYNFWLKNHYW